MKYALIRAHQAEFDVRAMCRSLQIHFSNQEGEVLESIVTKTRGRKAALKLLKKSM